jgi:hypothetical protein
VVTAKALLVSFLHRDSLTLSTMRRSAKKEPQITIRGGTNGRRLRLSGYFLFGVSIETNDFFQDEAGRCRDNAKKATRKDDQEFWLNLASRWETMLRTGKREPKVELTAGIITTTIITTIITRAYKEKGTFRRTSLFPALFVTSQPCAPFAL